VVGIRAVFVHLSEDRSLATARSWQSASGEEANRKDLGPP
jgi:hypothetical protein